MYKVVPVSEVSLSLHVLFKDGKNVVCEMIKPWPKPSTWWHCRTSLHLKTLQRKNYKGFDVTTCIRWNRKNKNRKAGAATNSLVSQIVDLKRRDWIQLTWGVLNLLFIINSCTLPVIKSNQNNWYYSNNKTIFWLCVQLRPSVQTR